MIKKKVVCYGEILWDNLPEGRRLGGAPLNVCYHLTKQAIEAKVISQIGDDENGSAILNEMKRLKIATDLCDVSTTYPTSTVEVHLQANGEIRYEIVDQVAWDYIYFRDAVAAEIASADAFVFGSLAVRNEQSRATLFSYLEHAKWKVLDVNLRTPFYDSAVIIELVGHCQTLKINDDELGCLAKWLSCDVTAESDILKFLLARFPLLQEIILTKGAEGAVYYGGDEQYQVRAPGVVVKDTVGSGDSFLAAFLAHRLMGKSIADSMKAGAVLSAYVAGQSGACPTYSAETIIEFVTRYRANRIEGLIS